MVTLYLFCIRVGFYQTQTTYVPVSAVEARDDVDVAGVGVDDARGGEVVPHAAVV